MELGRSIVHRTVSGFYDALRPSFWWSFTQVSVFVSPQDRSGLREEARS